MAGAASFTWFRKARSLPAVLCLVAGCSVAPPEPETDRPAPGSTPPLNSPAVVELSANARQALEGGRLDQAAQLLERAIRIEPQNGALWYNLARVRFQEGHYEQAMQLANRSNALPGTRGDLRDRNDRLIRASRQALSN